MISLPVHCQASDHAESGLQSRQVCTLQNTVQSALVQTVQRRARVRELESQARRDSGVAIAAQSHMT